LGDFWKEKSKFENLGKGEGWEWGPVTKEKCLQVPGNGAGGGGDKGPQLMEKSYFR